MYLLGASGHAKVIIDILQLNNIKIEALYDKDESKHQLCGYKVYPESKLSGDEKLIISIGDNRIRKIIANKYNSHSFGNAIHPTACISQSCELGQGITIMGNSIINTETKIGNHVIINTSASIDHDCEIGDFVHIAPNATLCGGITIGEGALVGAGAVIIPNVSIGEWAVIGAGAVITQDIPSNAKVVGNPGRIINNNFKA